MDLLTPLTVWAFLPRLRVSVGSEEAHPKVLASVRRSNCTCGFPACSFHDGAADGCGVKEGISAIKLTSPHSPRSRRVGSSFHPAQRHRLW